MKQLYLCDIEKNEGCTKTNCIFSETGECRATSDINFARLDADGKPIVLREGTPNE